MTGAFIFAGLQRQVVQGEHDCFEAFVCVCVLVYIVTFGNRRPQNCCSPCRTSSGSQTKSVARGDKDVETFLASCRISLNCLFLGFRRISRSFSKGITCARVFSPIPSAEPGNKCKTPIGEILNRATGSDAVGFGVRGGSTWLS
jgi:hypothetical protein